MLYNPYCERNTLKVNITDLKPSEFNPVRSEQKIYAIFFFDFFITTKKEGPNFCEKKFRVGLCAQVVSFLLKKMLVCNIDVCV